MEPNIPEEDILPSFVEGFTDDRKVTEDWVSYILSALQEGEIAASGLGVPQEDISEEEEDDSVDEESLNSKTGRRDLVAEDVEGSILSDVQGFNPPGLIRIPPPPIIYGTTLDSNVAEQKPVIETRDALDTTIASLVNLATAIPAMGEALASHFTPQVADLIRKLNTCDTKLQLLQSYLGDVDKMNDVLGVKSVAEAVALAMDEVLDATLRISAVEMVNQTIKEDVKADVNAKLVQAHTQMAKDVATQLKAIITRVFKLERSGAGVVGPVTTVAIPQLTMNMTIVDDHNNVQMTLGDLMRTVGTLTSEVKCLTSALAANGGVKIGDVVYSSEDELRVDVLNLTNRDVAAAFCDPVSILSHDEQSFASIDPKIKQELKNLVKQGVLLPANQRHLSTFTKPYPAGYTKGDEIEVGKTLNCFAKEDLWDGKSGLDGHQTKIKKSVQRGGQKAKSFIKQHIPKFSPLYEVAFDMVTKSIAFHEIFHQHVTEEKRHLQQIGINPDEVMLLISEQFILIFNELYTIRSDVFDFVDGDNNVDHLTRVIWVTALCHMAMDSYVVNGLKYHQIIASSFVRFLTRQLGQKSDDKVKQLVKDVASLKMEAKEGKTVAVAQRDRLNALYTNNATTLKLEKKTK